MQALAIDWIGIQKRKRMACPAGAPAAFPPLSGSGSVYLGRWILTNVCVMEALGPDLILCSDTPKSLMAVHLRGEQTQEPARSRTM